MRRRFPIRFTGLNKAMVVLGLLPSWSWVAVDDVELRVQMSYAFRLAVPRSSIRSAVPDDRRVWCWGVHGWRGVWLVNGSSHGIVRIDIDPAARGRVLGWPVRVRTLLVAVEDPSALVASVST